MFSSFSTFTARKVSKYGVISGPYLPAFGLNTERYGVYLSNQSECEKIRTRNYAVFGHFSRSASFKDYFYSFKNFSFTSNS